MRTFRELEYEREIEKLKKEVKTLQQIILVENLFNITNNPKKDKK